MYSEKCVDTYTTIMIKLLRTLPYRSDIATVMGFGLNQVIRKGGAKLRSVQLESIGLVGHFSCVSLMSRT